MTTIVKQKMTLEEFLNYDDNTDYLYELEDGEIIQMASESRINQKITIFLLIYFSKQNISLLRLVDKTEMIVSSSVVNVRIPDLIILSMDLAKRMEGLKRSLITPDMPPPDLVVEVVSPNQSKRDYEDKRSEYCARGIPEYWIVDPVLQKITVLQLKEGLYDERVYREEQPIVSLILGQLDLTAAELLRGGEE